MATLGYTGTGTSNQTIADYDNYQPGASDLRAGYDVVASENGTINSIKAYIGGDANTDVTAIVSIKDSEGANSHGELCKATVNNNSSTYGWVTFTISGSPEITNTTTYIINIVGDGTDLSPSGGFNVKRLFEGSQTYYSEYYDTYDSPANPWGASASGTGYKFSVYIDYTPEATGTNTQINIADTMKAVASIQVNIADTFKPVASMQVNIADTWKTVF